MGEDGGADFGRIAEPNYTTLGMSPEIGIDTQPKGVVPVLWAQIPSANIC